MTKELVEALEKIANDPYTNAFARTIALNALDKYGATEGSIQRQV